MKYLLIFCFLFFINKNALPCETLGEDGTNVYILLGPPGSGKTTLSHVLVTEKGYERLSAGDSLRSDLKEGLAFAIRYREQIETGLPGIPPDEIQEYVREKLERLLTEGKNKIILDNFPRIESQAIFLKEVLERNGLWQKTKALLLDISDDIATERMLNRRACANCNLVYNLKFCPPRDSAICDKCAGELFQRSCDIEISNVTRRLENFRMWSPNIISFFGSEGKIVDFK